MPFDGAFSPLHWLIVAVVALLVLGPDKLPQAGREFARALRFIHEARATITQEISQVLEPDDNAPGFGNRVGQPAPTDLGAPDAPEHWSS